MPCVMVLSYSLIIMFSLALQICEPGKCMAEGQLWCSYCILKWRKPSGSYLGERNWLCWGDGQRWELTFGFCIVTGIENTCSLQNHIFSCLSWKALLLQRTATDGTWLTSCSALRRGTWGTNNFAGESACRGLQGRKAIWVVAGWASIFLPYSSNSYPISDQYDPYLALCHPLPGLLVMQPFSAKLLSSQLASSMWWMGMFLPRCRTLHSPFLSCTTFLLACFSSLLKSLWMQHSSLVHQPFLPVLYLLQTWLAVC